MVQLHYRWRTLIEPQELAITPWSWWLRAYRRKIKQWAKDDLKAVWVNIAWSGWNEGEHTVLERHMVLGREWNLKVSDANDDNHCDLVVKTQLNKQRTTWESCLLEQQQDIFFTVPICVALELIQDTWSKSAQSAHLLTMSPSCFSEISWGKKGCQFNLIKPGSEICFNFEVTGFVC